MKKWCFLIAAILALASVQPTEAGGVAFRSRVVVRPAVAVQAFAVRPAFVGFRQQVVVQQFVQPVAVQQYATQAVVADYGVQQIVQPVQVIQPAVQVQAIAVQPLILRSRVVRFVGY